MDSNEQNTEIYKYDEYTEIKNPYKLQIINASISLDPKELNFNLKANIKNYIHKKYNKKCIIHGFVKNVTNINFDSISGYLSPENQINSSVIFNVDYMANICIPLIGDFLPVKIIKRNQKLLLAKFDNIKIIINLVKSNINLDKFEIQENEISHKSTKKILSTNDEIIIKISGIKFHIGDTDIKALGILHDYYTENEMVEKFLNDVNKETKIINFSYENVK